MEYRISLPSLTVIIIYRDSIIRRGGQKVSTDLKRDEGGRAVATPPRRSDQPYANYGDGEEFEEGAAGAQARRRSSRISRDEVFAAADALLVEGARPSIERVRLRIGRGSPNTINEHLDVWWRKLGSRLRDLPGGEFPQLPETIAQRLLQLWNEALAAAHESLKSTLEQRNASLDAREQQLTARELAAQQKAQAAEARAAALEAALELMRRQLEEANLRARTIEEALATRDADLTGLRGELDRLQRDYAQLLTQQEHERAAATAERARLEGRHEATEARWLAEVDRARQAAKAADHHLRELEARLESARKDREALLTDAQRLRGELATAKAVREQLEARLNAQAAASAGKKTRTARSGAAKPRSSSNRAAGSHRL